MEDFLTEREPITWSAPDGFPASLVPADPVLPLERSDTGLEVLLTMATRRPTAANVRRACSKLFDGSARTVLLVTAYPTTEGRSGVSLRTCGRPCRWCSMTWRCRRPSGWPKLRSASRVTTRPPEFCWPTYRSWPLECRDCEMWACWPRRNCGHGDPARPDWFGRRENGPDCCSDCGAASSWRAWATASRSFPRTPPCSRSTDGTGR